MKNSCGGSVVSNDIDSTRPDPERQVNGVEVGMGVSVGGSGVFCGRLNVIVVEFGGEVGEA